MTNAPDPCLVPIGVSYLETPWGTLHLQWQEGFLIAAHFMEEYTPRKIKDLPFSLPDFPIRILGTPWEVRVREALRRIPAGKCISYSELALHLGKPSAARAVARAVATNPLALWIPCHRVVPKTGGTGEYRWGAERKRDLLAEEQAVVLK